MVRVEKEHEQAVAGIRRQFHAGRRAARLDRHRRLGAIDADVFELIDLLDDAVLEDLEVRFGQVGDRFAVLEDVRVNAYEVGLGAEDGRFLTLWR